jgi:hypothetical protein
MQNLTMLLLENCHYYPHCSLPFLNTQQIKIQKRIIIILIKDLIFDNWKQNKEQQTFQSLSFKRNKNKKNKRKLRDLITEAKMRI